MRHLTVDCKQQDKFENKYLSCIYIYRIHRELPLGQIRKAARPGRPGCDGEDSGCATWGRDEDTDL